MVLSDPGSDCRSRFFKGAELIQPETLFVDRPDHPFGLDIASRIVAGIENLIDTQLDGIPHEGHRGRLRTIVRNKV